MPRFGDKDIDSLFREFKEFDNLPEEKDLLDYIGDYQTKNEEEEQKPPRRRGRPRKNR